MSSKLGIAATLKAAASVCGISRRVVQAAKNQGCAATRSDGRVDCDGLVEWLAQHPETLAIAGQALSRDEEVVLKIRAERKIKEHTLKEREGKFIPIDEAKKAIGDMIANAKKVLLPGPMALAPQVVGVSIVEAETVIKAWLHEAMSQLSADPTGAGAADNKESAEPPKSAD
jgi:hypothetical protein